jgi:hypothetical protein
MRVNWSKSESRDVRPFFDVESLATAMDSAAIKLHETMAYTSERAFVLSEQDSRRLEISVRHGLDVRSVAACKALKLADVSIVAIVGNPFLKRTRVVERHSLAGTVPDEISIGPEVVEALGGPSNLVLNVCLCLDRELKKAVGRPYFPGHWLSRTTFTIRSARIAEQFDVEPLDDEGWKARSLPPKTLYYVEYLGPINEAPVPNQQVAKVYLHADVYRQMAAESDPRKSRAIQSMLAAEIVCQILHASLAEWANISAPAERSPLAVVLKRINKNYKCSLMELRKLVEGQGMQRLRAVLQNDQEIVRAIVEG